MTSPSNRIDGVAEGAPALAGFGPLPIGVRTIELTNPGQIDLTTPDMPRYDRSLTVEMWYPTTETRQGGSYDTLLRDGKTPVRLQGRALRDAPGLPGAFPLVILSHGYPGNRMLMAHLGETLASCGYLVASIDHRNSTYDRKLAFIDTLVNRPLDTGFVARALGAGDYAIIGYSMGGYGALVAGGAGVSEAALTSEPYGGAVLAQHRQVTPDPRLRAIIPIGPWGRKHGIWDAAGLAGLRVPCLIMAGSEDTISGYADGMRLIFDEAVNAPRHLLTFKGAGHNAAAPFPAPAEAFTPSPDLPFLPAEHYADPVWDTLQMNSIAQHFARAFLDLHVKGETGRSGYLTAACTGIGPSIKERLMFESAGRG